MESTIQAGVEVLTRPFRIIAFDWDGTAVENRLADAANVRLLLEKLLGLNVIVVVITGTNFANIDRQFSSFIHGPRKCGLVIATNRGSEVYGFDAASRPVLLWQRNAGPAENTLLDEIAETVRDELAATYRLDVHIVYKRLNRRKIDLIPIPEWSDPPKSAIGELLTAVEERLRGAGVPGGLRDVYDLVERTAEARGLTGARITSDVKHIEVGLTDKADSIRWMLREIALPRGIPLEDILILGDEFGPIAGFEGSDYKMLVPELRGAVIASVGKEPNGVPEGVLDLGGGPVRFRELLARQIVLHEEAHWRPPRPYVDMRRLPVAILPTDDPDWVIEERGFNIAREHEIESLFTIANGYAGTRGSVAQGTSLSQPATFLAGVFDLPPTPGAVPDLVKVPDWTRLRIMVEGHELRLEEGEILGHVRVLDMRQGLLWREWRQRDNAGRVTRVRTVRLASLADRHLFFQTVELTPENYAGRVSFVSEFVPPDAGPVEERRSTRPEPGTPWIAELTATDRSLFRHRTGHAGIEIALAATELFCANEETRCLRQEEAERRPGLYSRWERELAIGMSAHIFRLVTIFTSREVADPAAAADARLAQAAEGVGRIVDDHLRAWTDRWETADVQVEGDPVAQRALRFAAYHLISAANPSDERSSIGARALTGGSYKGHVFWDTDIFMVPFYIYTAPEAARSLLLYRYHTLPAAVARAREHGYRGAMYAWESADTGEETTPSYVFAPSGQAVRVLTGEEEQHISADVAYATWLYWEATGDERFFADAGAEILIQTARFWAGRVETGSDGGAHITKVIGPDEYHETIDDNAYTNVLARWNLRNGAGAARYLAERHPERWRDIAQRLDVTPDEPASWLATADAIYTGFDEHTGLFEQFRGFFSLEDVDIAAHGSCPFPIDVLLGREKTQGSQVIKQADVVALLVLLWDRFPARVREANFRYYEPRTCHGSSLSPAFHALAAARLGDTRLAAEYFRQTAEIDLANNMGNASGGVHMAALGGLWQAAVFGFAGMRETGEGLVFDPHLPESWRSLRVPVRRRGSVVTIRFDREPPQIDLVIEGEEPVRIALVDGPALLADPGSHYRTWPEGDGWAPWQAACI